MANQGSENILTGLYENSNGFHSLEINDYTFEKITKILANLEKGSKLVVVKRKKAKAKDTDADAFLVYRTKAEVEEFKAKRPPTQGL